MTQQIKILGLLTLPLAPAANKFMLYFTKYAENKFDILNKHKVFFTREQIENTVGAPDKISKKGKLLTAQKENVKVIYKKEAGVIKIITFFPVKS